MQGSTALPISQHAIRHAHPVIVFPWDSKDDRFNRDVYATYLSHDDVPATFIDPHLEKADNIGKRRSYAGKIVFYVWLTLSVLLLIACFALAFVYSVAPAGRVGIFVGWFIIVVFFSGMSWLVLRDRSKLMRREILRLNKESYPIFAEYGYKWEYEMRRPRQLELRNNHVQGSDWENHGRQ